MGKYRRASSVALSQVDGSVLSKYSSINIIYAALSVKS